MDTCANIFIYGSAFWTFYNGYLGGNSGDDQRCQSTYCQTNAVDVQNTGALYWFNLNTHASLNMLTSNGSALVTVNNNAGSWGGVVAAFLYDS